MPVNIPGRLFVGDEELGKRDDDYKKSKKSPLGGATSWQARKAPIRRNFKKIIYGLGVLVLVYYFIKYIPTDVQHRNLRPSYQPPKEGVYDPWIPSTSHNDPALKVKKPAVSDSIKNEQADSAHKLPLPQGIHTTEVTKDPHYYDGPVKFYELASSLHKAAAETAGNFLQNQNVLFVAANLKSASLMLSLACEMAEWKRNDVHFVFMARDDISIELLKSINGVDKGCPIIFHDARPDFAAFSSDDRLTISATAALSYFERFIHPQAIILDGSGIEELPFLKASRSHSESTGQTLIELSRDAAQTLRWFTRLDAASLTMWNKVTIEIIIHAQEAASGSLIRLLTSLWKADYGSTLPPRLTIELPHKIDSPTEEFLRNFRWPPPHHGDSNLNLLTLRHRTPGSGVSTMERMVESFWPANAAVNHVLVLSAHVELSRIYYQYLKYTLLEYKYSSAAALSPINLFGISLDLPTTLLNDKEPLVPPPYPLPFLWQAPNSNAALYFGTVWQELHSLLGHLSVPSTLPHPETIDTKPQVSSTYPSWLEHLLTLARVRGYYMLYPSLSSTAEKLVTIHTELYQAPSDALEISNRNRKDTNPKDLPSLSDEYLDDHDDHLSLSYPEAGIVRANLLEIFFPESRLPSLNDMKFLRWSGEQVAGLAQSMETTDYAMAYRVEIGGCKPGERVAYKEGEVIDLFCYGHPSGMESVQGQIVTHGDETVAESVQPDKVSASWQKMLRDAERDEATTPKVSNRMVPTTSAIAGNRVVQVTTKGLKQKTIANAETMRTRTAHESADTATAGHIDLDRHEHGRDRIPGTGLRR